MPESASFAELGVSPKLVASLAAQGVVRPFPIQVLTLADALAGRDILGRGQTGSGKTYAFLIPVVSRLAARPRPAKPGRPRALILAPTRELATQICSVLAPLAKAASLTTVTVFGGTSAKPQISALRRGVDIVVACPGRLDDHVRSGHAHLGDIEITVIDEADHMADLGFLPVVRRLLDATPKGGQRLLFSATLDGAVRTLADRYLAQAVTHSLDGEATSEPLKMTHHVLQVEDAARLPVLVDLASAPGRTLVFTRTRHGAKRLAKQLAASGVRVTELHGDLSQAHRTRNLTSFASGRSQTLVATDVAARGIHVDDVRLVIHADPPSDHKAYVHRSGRTARAGAVGTVVTLTRAAQLRDVRALTKKAGVRPLISSVSASDPLLIEIAPGDRATPVALPDRVATAPSRPVSTARPRQRSRSARPRRKAAA